MDNLKLIEVKELLKIKYDLVISTSKISGTLLSNKSTNPLITIGIVLGFNSGYVAEVTDAPLIFISPPGPLNGLTAPLGNVFDPARYCVVGTDCDQDLASIRNHFDIRICHF